MQANRSHYAGNSSGHPRDNRSHHKINPGTEHIRRPNSPATYVMGTNSIGEATRRGRLVWVENETGRTMAQFPARRRVNLHLSRHVVAWHPPRNPRVSCLPRTSLEMPQPPRRAHDFRGLEFARQEQGIRAAFADDNARARLIDLGVGLHRRGVAHQVKAFDEQVRCRQTDRRGASWSCSGSQGFEHIGNLADGVDGAAEMGVQRTVWVVMMDRATGRIISMRQLTPASRARR
ncbi:hypothetical protein PTE31013_02003 [Pandoraea terrigena]|uniref:Uncharacterized protein n=1 Tax=Pandoraea terrigena TaxID=2508292 RepID=A0A5E4UHF3_9BURK|nr:hypothetical protein PTE31013_02003 [Pandoraea terrigena]